jgi:hypothetical protein
MVLWFYGRVKTTIELPDDLYRAAKAEAALRGRPLKELVEEGLRLALSARRKSSRRRIDAIMERACGMVDSGVPDLATNPAHMKDFGTWRDDDR